MLGWIISAAPANGQNATIQTYGNASTLYPFNNTGNLPRGRVVNFTPPVGGVGLATNITDAGYNDAEPVQLSYAPQ
jgi:hypothetical protein